MATLPNSSPFRRKIDRAGIALSALCAAHCMLVLLLAGAFGGLLLQPIFHEVGLALAVLLGVVAFSVAMVRGGPKIVLLLAALGIAFMTGALQSDHGSLEAALTIIGVALLAGAHWFNLRRAH